MDNQFATRIGAVTGRGVSAIRPLTVEGGYSNAYRRIVRFEDAGTAFLKAGTTPFTAAFLRLEYAKVYGRLEALFLPKVIGWDDDGDTPLLMLEDLSHAHWPPPWSAAQVGAVRETIAGIHALPVDDPSVRDAATSGLSQLEGSDFGWRGVALDAAPFLSLGLCSPGWLDRHLDTLVDASSRVQREGDEFCHFDLRSDNICFDGDRVVVVDWNWSAKGNGQLDIAFWLPSLASEGGPLPEVILPDAANYAALVSGYFAAQAGRPRIEAAPRVREVQTSQLRQALPWSIRALGLAPLDGTGA